MIYHYLNACFQGSITNHHRQGPGIVIDTNNNFISSDFDNDDLSGGTFICLHGDLFVFGTFRGGRMEGVNTVDSAEYKSVGRYVGGRMVGRGLVVNKRTRSIYVIENRDEGGGGRVCRTEPDENDGFHNSKKNEWKHTLHVVNRYTLQQTKSLDKIKTECGIVDFDKNDIEQFLETMMEPVYCCYQSKYQLYFGYVGTNNNLGVTFSPSTLTFSPGVYKQPFVPITTEFQRSPTHSPNLIHKTVFFPELITVKQNFINVLKFVSVFEEKLLDIENSEILVGEQSVRSDREIKERILEGFGGEEGSNENLMNFCSTTSRKSVAIEKLNKSLGELLVMQEEMLINRQSKERQSKQQNKKISQKKYQTDKKYTTYKKQKQQRQANHNHNKQIPHQSSFGPRDKWLSSYYKQQQQKLMLRANKATLKQELYTYLQQQKSYIIPACRSKSKSPIKSPRKNPQLRSPTSRNGRSPFDTMKMPKSILKTRKLFK